MNKIWAIIKREYVVRVRTRAFVISTIASPLLLLALALLPGLLAARGGGERHVTVLDQSGDDQLYAAFQQRNESRANGAEQGENDDGPNLTRYVLTRQVLPPGEDASQFVQREMSEPDKSGGDRAYLVLGPDVLGGGQPQYYAKNLSDFSLGALRQSLSAAIAERRLLRAGLDASKIKEYTKPVELKTGKIDSRGGIQESGARQEFMLAFVLLFFLYMTVLFYGIFVMRGVIEEKQSRIVEIVVSSLKPTQLMFGKLIGIGMVGLTQISIWALSAGLLSFFGAQVLGPGAKLPNIRISLLIYFVLFFLLGYFLYATLYAIVGAMVSSEEEAQQIQFPVTILIVVPMMIFGIVMANPNGPASVALSMVPFFAPTLMMLRISLVSPPLWQIALSMLIMLATTVVLLWMAARIYRVGILMYGKRPSLAELGRWLRYS
jgi:ABC-2 type transport system permease protein